VHEEQPAAGVAATSTSQCLGMSGQEAVAEVTVTDWPPADSALAKTSYAETGHIDLQVEVDNGAELQQDALSLTAAGSPRSQTSSYAGATAADETVADVIAGATGTSGNDSAAVRRIELRRRAYFGRVQRNAASGNDSEQQCSDEEHHEITTAVDAHTSSSTATTVATAAAAAAAAAAVVVPRGRVLHSHLAAPPVTDVSATSAVPQRPDQQSNQGSPNGSTGVQSHEQQLWERFTLAKAVVSASSSSSDGSSASGDALMRQLIECIQGGSSKQLRSVLECSEAQTVLQQTVGTGNDNEAGMCAHVTTYTTYNHAETMHTFTCSIVHPALLQRTERPVQ
jgi:hypothetical protein